MLSMSTVSLGAYTFPPGLKAAGNITAHRRAGGEWRGWDPFQGAEISQES